MVVENNKANAILSAAAAGKYAVPAVVVYNLEGIIAVSRAAATKRSPCMLLLFPWAQTYSHTALAALAHYVCTTSPVPMTLHLDHAQDAQAIREAADMGFYDSIMIDMSRHEKEENLRMTKELVAYCNERGIATEAEPGRIEGGEDGLKGTEDLEGLLTTPEEAGEFVSTGIDWLAPAFGNVHGAFGPRGIQLEYDRLESINRAVGDRVRLVLHGTAGFDQEIFRKCVVAGISKVNINKVMNRPYMEMQAKGGLGLIALMEQGTHKMQSIVERIMDELGSSGKAPSS
ncbi:hypothetical protein MMC25_005864 [Agyrium rufum]|nr:hypothetical protein [Agyrium rufum]